MNIAQRVIQGIELQSAEALELLQTESTEQLVAWANEVREHFRGKQLSLCTITSAKSGNCSEDCKYCAQSAHYHTEAPVYDMITKEIALERAKEMEAKGVHRFSLVTSGHSLSEGDFQKILEIIPYLKEHTGLTICASLGFVNEERAKALKQHGLDFYHHNLEASTQFFPQICTTHTIEEKIGTIKILQENGIPVCSGGILGLGEEQSDRLELIYLLKSLGVVNIPVNILTPIKGTPLEGQAILDGEEAIRTVAIWRLVHPTSEIRWAGGRNNLQQWHDQGMQCGIDGLMVSNYLTTKGLSIDEDLNRLSRLGYEVSHG